MGVDTGYMRVTIRVRPGSARPGVGGEHDGALVVRVSARAVDGKATEAALAAVAARSASAAAPCAWFPEPRAALRSSTSTPTTQASSRPCSPRPIADVRDEMPSDRQS